MTKLPGFIGAAGVVLATAACLSTFPLGGDYDSAPGRRWDTSARIVEYAVELDRRAAELALDAYERVLGRGGQPSDMDLAAMFEAERFAAASRLFLRLVERSEGSASRSASRATTERAFRLMAGEFGILEDALRRMGAQSYALSGSRTALRRLGEELGVAVFESGAGRDRIEGDDLDGMYVKGRGADVYLIEGRGGGDYTRRPFKNMESLFKYNYDRDRGKNPWDFLVEAPRGVFDTMREGAAIERTFEGLMIIEQGDRPNRPVYLIRGGKRLGLSRPDLVSRYGGWGKVFEVPREVITAYEEGETIK